MKTVSGNGWTAILRFMDLTAIAQDGSPWRLSDHLDTPALLFFLRGDW